MKLTAKNISKRQIFFVLDDVLVPGKVTPQLSGQKVKTALSFLKGLEDKNLIELFLIAGQEKDKADVKISKGGIGFFFRPENMFFITPEYIASKEQLDRERHEAMLEKDPQFVDDYFTQYTLMNLIKSGQILKEKSVLIGHDIWMDAFYSSRFSQVQCVLLAESLSEKNTKSSLDARWLNLIDLTEGDLKKVILWKFKDLDPKQIEAHVFNKLKKEFLQGVDFSSLVNKSLEKAALKENNK